MVNSVDFTNRIKKVIDYYDFSASSFADKIGVQRSSISHILSGRNKPSLDFILKITSTFKEVDIHWLINGKGVFPKTAVEDIESSTTPTFNQNENSSKSIQRIVVFYNDGTFDEYKK
ncbi:MAG: helix-turn-helix transcriptional regulator [Flavobacteriaceae bacterium]|nr:helix-turn-helix transcriptional regulator [Flavobacteriaceae bacterium]